MRGARPAPPARPLSTVRAPRPCPPPRLAFTPPALAPTPGLHPHARPSLPLILRVQPRWVWGTPALRGLHLLEPSAGQISHPDVAQFFPRHRFPLAWDPLFPIPHPTMLAHLFWAVSDPPPPSVCLGVPLPSVGLQLLLSHRRGRFHIQTLHCTVLPQASSPPAGDPLFSIKPPPPHSTMLVQPFQDVSNPSLSVCGCPLP